MNPKRAATIRIVCVAHAVIALDVVRDKYSRFLEAAFLEIDRRKRGENAINVSCHKRTKMPLQQ